MARGLIWNVELQEGEFGGKSLVAQAKQLQPSNDFAQLLDSEVKLFKRFAHSAGPGLVGQRLNGMLRNRRVRP